MANINENKEAYQMMKNALGSIENRFREAYNKGYKDGLRDGASQVTAKLVSKILEETEADTPQTETQMKTQNSNLTFKTLEYCDICDHKGCEECIANALDEHCMPSHFNKQIEDECAKEYEELGLKELKELIEADRKDEPHIVGKHADMVIIDEPQTERIRKCIDCRLVSECRYTNPDSVICERFWQKERSE